MKEKLPLISIIIPVYNVERYLRTCLESVISQTLENIEIICINDASPDGSLAILREYEEKDSRVVVIDLKENIRQGGARNQGIQKAKAKYIGFVDSDDWIANDMYELLYEKAISTNADLVHCDYYRYSNETLNAESQFSKDTWLKNRSLANKDFILVSEFPVTAIYNKQLFIANNLYFPERTFYEDSAIIPLLYLLANRVEHIDKSLYFYRIHSSSTSHRVNDEHFFQCSKTLSLFLENARRLGLYEQYKEEMEFAYIRYAYWSVIWGSLFLFPVIRTDMIRQAKKEITKTFPYYRKNIYYKKRVLTKKRLVLDCLDANTWLCVNVVKYILLFRLKKERLKYLLGNMKIRCLK